MERTSANARTTWTTKHGRDAGAPAVTALGGIVRQQIKSRGNEIDELKLRHRTHSHQCRTTRRTDNCTFGYRRIDYAFFAKFIQQAISDFKRAAICTNVLANNED